MRFRRLFLVIPVILLAAPPVRAQVLVGPNLDWSYWSVREPLRDESGNVLSVGGHYLSPGLRVGYLFPNAAFVASADVGIQTERLGSLEYTNVIVEPALSYAFMSDHASSPYIAISYGWHHLSLEELTRPVVSGAVGFRHRVAAGHGFVRGEFRYDHFTKEDTGGLLLPENITGVRVGVDLLLTR